jgi:ribonuclease D
MASRQHNTAQAIHASRSAIVRDKSIADIAGVNLTEHSGLANAPRNELRDLRAKIKDQNSGVHDE